MTFEFPVEPGQVLLFARSVGDYDSVYDSQLYASPGAPLVAPPTFFWSCEHFNPESDTRPLLPCKEAGQGGRSDMVHAEQHFEYFQPMRAGERVVVETFPGANWTKPGRSGMLEFRETVTEFRNHVGQLKARARKVSVRILGQAADV